MRIVIDMQGAQTESRFRGIGRYTMAFAQAVVRNRGDHEILLALSGLFPETINPIRNAFEGLLPQDNIRVWDALGPVKEEQTGNDARREAAELVREAFLASLHPDVIHVTSLFEGYVDDAVTSIGRFDTQTPVSVTLYDLIPLLNPDHYLKPNPRYRDYYRCKVEYLERAALHLAISEFSRREGMDALGTPDSKSVAISTALDSHFQRQDISNESASELSARFGISRPFVLYTGGADERKNLPRLIKAYAELPVKLREAHQLLFAGKMPEGDIARLRGIARSAGLMSDELLFTGYVSDDELVRLYNLCHLYIFPSWHEGFGLPALEAMACGAPVIGANTASLPEVIELEEALFDPLEVQAITEKLMQALGDEAFRNRLRKHGLQQSKKFSWDETAKRAIAAWETIPLSIRTGGYCPPSKGRKPRLAFVSPLPPERTGIADYSAELLPALSAHYDIDLVVAQDRVEDPRVNQLGEIRDANWLCANAQNVDRVLYQVGNSPFHQHMLHLMREVPGIAVLHDFYLSDLLTWLELERGVGPVWTKALYESHGYAAVQARYQDLEAAKRIYPANAQVLQYARGIIVHSEYSREMARQHYGSDFARLWRVIPHLRSPCQVYDGVEGRSLLGFEKEDFLVCSFGFLDSTKLNHRTLHSWLQSKLAHDEHCHLVFVGENHGGDYGAELLKTIRASGFKERIHITGYASPDVFKKYLAAADIAVQLRAQSRGETSGTVLDCMNHSLPVIVNRNGSLSELDPATAWMLPDEFEDSELINALEKLWQSPELRSQLGKRAREDILVHHAPDACAQQYVEAIEAFYDHKANSLPALIEALSAKPGSELSKAETVQLASALGRNHPLPRLKKRLYLDITATCDNDLKTGIERVARALTLALLQSPPESFRIEPVYLSCENGRWLYRHARRYTLGLLSCPLGGFDDEVIELENGDVLLGLDLSGDRVVQAQESGLFEDLRRRGGVVYFMVHDLLPVRMPEVFPPGADHAHEKWLLAISKFDGAVCVSKAVASDLHQWLQGAGAKYNKSKSFKIAVSHHGADIDSSAPTLGESTAGEEIPKAIGTRPTFLMVGTIEPRKGYLQVLDAFDQLWREGVDVNLVIVGREGWKSLPDEMRRDIPETARRLRTHPELNNRLFWLEGISDGSLDKIYAASTCLIAASYGEGFGLPLIEGAQHRLPIIARDIPVFREVAGEHAYYFGSEDPQELSVSLKHWLELSKKGEHPISATMPWLTWKESAANLKRVLISEFAQAEMSHAENILGRESELHNYE